MKVLAAILQSSHWLLRTMITEANAIEEEQFTLADETLLIEVLSDAILTSFKNDIPQMLTEHVVAAFERRMEQRNGCP